MELVPIIQINWRKITNYFLIMALVHPNELINRLDKARRDKNLSVPKLATELCIPQDRIYKWMKEGHNPKAEDVEIIKKWLGDKIEEVPSYSVDMQDYINALKKQVEIAEINNDFLRRMMEAEVSRVRISLELLQDDQMSSIALIKGAIDTQAELAAKVLNESVDAVKLKTGKAIASHATTLKQRGKSTSNQSR